MKRNISKKYESFLALQKVRLNGGFVKTQDCKTNSEKQIINI